MGGTVRRREDAGTASGRRTAGIRGGGAQARARMAAVAAVGIALFDVGQMFSRPRLTQIAGQLDIALIVAQGLSCLVVALLCLVARRRGRARAEAPTGKGPGGRGGAGSRRRGRGEGCAGRLALVGTCALGCALGEAALLAQGGGTSPTSLAFIGCVALGACFGLSWVGWLTLACDLARVAGVGRRVASAGAVAGLAVGKLAGLTLRALGNQQAWTLAGLCCLPASVALLAAMTLATTAGAAGGRVCVDGGRRRDAHDDAAGSRRGERGETVTTLLGCGLFSLLFGLMTQLHNMSAQATVSADVMSMTVSAALLAALCARLLARPARLRIDRLMLVTLPVIALVMIASPLFWQDVSDVSDAMVKSFFNLYLAATFAFVIGRPGAGLGTSALAMGVVWTSAAAGSVAGFAFVSAGSDVAMTGAFLAGTWLCMLVAVLAATISGRAAATAQAQARQAREEAAGARGRVVFVDRTEEQIRVLGDRAGLSERERQVAALLVQGRSAARVAEELVVSENTVKTHMQNIYAKLGIHTKQELLDLVRSVPLPEPDDPSR